MFKQNFLEARGNLPPCFTSILSKANHADFDNCFTNWGLITLRLQSKGYWRQIREFKVFQPQESIREGEPNSENFFFASLFPNQITGKAPGVPPQGPGLHCFSLWSNAIAMLLRTVENLYFGCKQTDGFKANGGPRKDASICILGVGNNDILELLFLWQISFKGISYTLTKHSFPRLPLC